MSERTRELHAALRAAEKIAASGGAYGLAERLAKMAEPLSAWTDAAAYPARTLTS